VEQALLLAYPQSALAGRSARPYKLMIGTHSDAPITIPSDSGDEFVTSLPWTSTRLSLSMLILSLIASAQTAEQRTARYFDSVRNQPGLLLAFLHDMPKGGDLHNHLDGAIYAEDLIDFAASDNLCVDRTTSQLIAPPCDSCEKYTAKPEIRCAYGDHVLYNQIIDAWSMRNWRPGDESGHDHFFATFDKFSLASHGHTAEAMATILNRAAREQVQYVEFMRTGDGGGPGRLAAQLGWNDDLDKMRQGLLDAGLREIAAAASKSLAETEARARAEMKCDTSQPKPGCGVTVRFLYQALRALPREAVFAQLLLGFELASSDPRVVGLNLVQPEDWYTPIHDFHGHMAMLDYLHTVYPSVHISLHAGEIAAGMVKPEDLTYHIRESVERGHAERIGHGAAIMLEKDPIGLMKEMAARDVLVEINLTSNDQILGISGDDHPLPVYIRYGVPVAISTDDQGVARSDMTHEYLRAAENYHFPYTGLKRMTRQSLQHSFLSGESLWATTSRVFRPVVACASDRMGSEKPSVPCARFLKSSDRAREQWKLEAAFAVFEKKF